MTEPLPSPAPSPLPTAQTTRHHAEAASLRTCAAFVARLRQFVPAERDAPAVKSYKRAALAALRRGLGKAPGEAPEMFPYIIPALPTGLSTRNEQAYFLIASLFAWRPLEWPYTPGDPHLNPSANPSANHSLGVSYRRLAEKTGSDSVEKRFIALLNAHQDDLPAHLRHAVGLITAQEIPIDWTRLLYDVLWWNEPNRSSQLSWARGYWAASSAATPSQSQTDTTDAGQRDEPRD